MKLNPDLIREILLQIESQPRGFIEDQLSLNGYSHEEIVDHLVLMMDNGLIDGLKTHVSGQRTPVVSVDGMTWAGYEFLDACRDEGRWVKAKETITRMGGNVSLDLLKSVLVKIAMSQISNHFGV
jgi:hypothetical protein